jgi:hypothetical protein
VWSVGGMILARKYRRALTETATKISSPSINLTRKELEISGIQDVRSKHIQNWINHLERMDNTRLPKHAIN